MLLVVGCKGHEYTTENTHYLILPTDGSQETVSQTLSLQA